jgi:hypothetical protein
MSVTHGVIGNTLDFGSKESRFETWWVNKEAVSKVHHLPLTLRSGYSSSSRRRKLKYCISIDSPRQGGAGFPFQKGSTI